MFSLILWLSCVCDVPCSFTVAVICTVTAVECNGSLEACKQVQTVQGGLTHNIGSYTAYKEGDYVSRYTGNRI